jgi:hypothetical protein
MEVYALESCLLRAEKLMAAKGEAGGAQAIALTRYYYAVRQVAQTVELRAQGDTEPVADRRADMLRTQMAILRRLVQVRAGRYHRSWRCTWAGRSP